MRRISIYLTDYQEKILTEERKKRLNTGKYIPNECTRGALAREAIEKVYGSDKK